VLVLVTGGCGFIGANLVRRLGADGHSVRVLDNLWRGRADNLDGCDVDIRKGDIRDAEAVDDALVGVDAVVHLAAAGSVIESIADPTENFDVNVRGTVSLLQGLVRADVRRIVFASTGGALIGNAEPPVDEQSLPWPISPYGASKLCGEAYLHAFAASYGLETVALRFANVYGPYSDHKKGAVTTFIVNALRGEQLVIFGDGSASRDLLYSDDLCEGIAAGLGSNLVDDVVHLASGRETTVLELAELVQGIVGDPNVTIEHRDARRGEVLRNFALAGKAKRELAFAPRETLESGMEKTIRWFADHRARWDAV
jgi:UDP-glucose 4-epimerase